MCKKKYIVIHSQENNVIRIKYLDDADHAISVYHENPQALQRLIDIILHNANG